MKPIHATLSKAVGSQLPSHIRHVQGSSANHLLVLPGLLTSAHESKKITRLMADAKSRGWSALSLDYFGCFSNEGDIWSGTCQQLPHPSVSEISWARWQNDIVDALRLVAWLPHQQQTTQGPDPPNHKLTIVGCSAGFALALDVLRDHRRSLAGRFGSVIHLVGVGASPDPRPRWRKYGIVDDSHWIWVPSPYAKDGRGYPLPIGLVNGESQAEITGVHSPERLRVTLIHGDADEVIPLERAMAELPTAVAAAWGIRNLSQERSFPRLVDVDVTWRVIRNGDHRLSREPELEVVVTGVFGPLAAVGKLE